MKLNSQDTAKIKRSKVKVTSSNESVAQKHQIYAVNVIGLWKYTGLIGNRGGYAFGF